MAGTGDGYDSTAIILTSTEKEKEIILNFIKKHKELGKIGNVPIDNIWTSIPLQIRLYSDGYGVYSDRLGEFINYFPTTLESVLRENNFEFDIFEIAVYFDEENDAYLIHNNKIINDIRAGQFNEEFPKNLQDFENIINYSDNCNFPNIDITKTEIKQALKQSLKQLKQLEIEKKKKNKKKIINI